MYFVLSGGHEVPRLLQAVWASLLRHHRTSFFGKPALSDGIFSNLLIRDGTFPHFKLEDEMQVLWTLSDGLQRWRETGLRDMRVWAFITDYSGSGVFAHGRAYRASRRYAEEKKCGSVSTVQSLPEHMLRLSKQSRYIRRCVGNASLVVKTERNKMYEKLSHLPNFETQASVFIIFKNNIFRQKSEQKIAIYRNWVDRK